MALNMLLFRLLCYAFLIVACNSSDDHFEFDFVKKTLKVEVIAKISIGSTERLA